MPNVKPFRGFPSRTAFAVHRRIKDRATYVEIGREMGLQPGSVRNLVELASPKGRKRRSETRFIADQFRRAAKARGVSASDLRHNVLLRIAHEPVLIDNILDDGASE